VHRTGSTERLGAHLAEAEVGHLALADELRHRADALLNRDLGSAAVHVVEIDPIDAEPAQGALASLADPFRAVVDAPLAAVAANAELGGDLGLLPTAGDGPADETLVVPR
jgi:hypothetical protein